ncbi:MAG: MarR family winged helix-turn-helix transcriptional regulator [Hyphomonadaceae bacterium]
MTLDFYRAPGFLIRRLHQISMSVFEQEMAANGIELTQVQYAALRALEQCPDIDQMTLAGLIAYDRVTIGGVVDRLVAKGFVARSVNSADRRARRLAITQEGRKQTRKAARIVKSLQRSILAGLSAQERQTLLALLVKTTDAGNAQSRAPLRQTPSSEPT